MNVPTLRRVRDLHRDRVLVLCLVVAAMTGFVVLTDVVWSMTYLGLVLVLLAGFAVLSETDGISGPLVVGALTLQWISSDAAFRTWWATPAAWLLLLAFAGTALVTTGPDTAPIPRQIRRRWAWRVGVVAAAATAVNTVGLLAPRLSWPALAYAAPVALIAMAIGAFAVGRVTARNRHDLPGSTQ